MCIYIHMAWWRNRQGVGLVIYRSSVRSTAVFAVTWRPYRQVVYTHVPPFTRQYRLIAAVGGDALKLARAWQKVMRTNCCHYITCRPSVSL